MARTTLGAVLAGSLIACGSHRPLPAHPAPVVTVPDLHDTIPDSLDLPGPTGTRHSEDLTAINAKICIDPDADLVDAEVVDGLTAAFRGAGGRWTTERLRLYANPGQAREAEHDFVSSVRQCLRGDHVGNPMTIDEVPASDLEDVDRAFHLSLATAEDGDFFTMVRVGRALYLVDREVLADALTGEALESTRAAAEDEVRPFIAELRRFRGA